MCQNWTTKYKEAKRNVTDYRHAEIKLDLSCITYVSESSVEDADIATWERACQDNNFYTRDNLWF